MRVSVNHDFERRVGLWPAGFDADGELFCNQRYGDWPMRVSGLPQDPWRDPDWMLLSVGRQACASSCTEGHEAEKATEENVRTWWQAKSADREEWLQIDLGQAFDIHAVQVNFADALGYNILFGSAPDKLYHSDLVFGAGERRVGALIKGGKYWVRVDAFNGNGITEGTCVPLEGEEQA